jgi:hypothetical protein
VATASLARPDLRPVDIPLALLCDYYEHVREHVPPRDPTHPLQQRERHYFTPSDPFDAIATRLSSSQPDTALRAQLAAWERQWASGRTASPAQLRELELLAAPSSLKAEVLLDAGRALNFLAGDDAAAAFFRAAIAKAEEQYRQTAVGDPAALPLLDQLQQTRALWRLRDDATLARRFALAARLYPTLSVETRRSECLLAHSLYYQGRSEDAANIILRLWEEDRQASDLGVADKSDFAEMDWLSGLYLAAARRYGEAVPYFNAYLQHGEDRKLEAVQYLAVCLKHLGRKSDADELLKKYGVATKLSATQPPGTNSRPGGPTGIGPSGYRGSHTAVEESKGSTDAK